MTLDLISRAEALTDATTFDDLPAAERAERLRQFRPDSFLVAAIAERTCLEAEIEQYRAERDRLAVEIDQAQRRIEALGVYLATYDAGPDTEVASVSAETDAPIPDTTAPKPLPEGQGDSAAVPLATDREIDQQPAEAKTVDQEPADASGSGGVQDRCESTPPTPSQTKASTDGGATAQAMERPADSVTGDASRASRAPGPGCNVDKADVTAGETAPSISPDPVTLTDQIEKKPTKKQQVLECYQEHPDWPARLIAEHLGLTASSVSGHAHHLGIKLPTMADYEAASRPEPPAEPVQAADPEKAPEPQPEPKRPSAPVENRPVRVVHTKPAAVAQRASVRFYVVDGKGRYLHQSLERSPTSDGPLMTSSRQWAWYDNAQRFEGAAKKWPEILEMRKEYPQA